MCNMSTSDCSTIGSCPFAPTTESEEAQNHGCLPTPYDIVEMRKVHGKTWACHSDETKPCRGALLHMRERGIECTVIDSELLTEEHHWENFVTYK